MSSTDEKSNPGGTPDTASEFKKWDTGKPRMDLIPPDVLLAVGRVLTIGAAQYGANNWVKGEYSRYIAALYRHLVAFQSGEANDPETGESHLAHLICCAAFLLAFETRKIGKDDRQPTINLAEEIRNTPIWCLDKSPGDANVRCTRTTGHLGDHHNAERDAAWSDTSRREPPPSTAIPGAGRGACNERRPVGNGMSYPCHHNAGHTGPHSWGDHPGAWGNTARCKSVSATTRSRCDLAVGHETMHANHAAGESWDMTGALESIGHGG